MSRILQKICNLGLGLALLFTTTVAGPAPASAQPSGIANQAESVQVSASGRSAKFNFQFPQGTTQYNLTVTPYNNDGPGVDLIRNAENSFEVQAPEIGRGNYVMLPGITHTWRVRTTDANSAVSLGDPSWRQLSSGTFRTAGTDSTTVKLIFPTDGGRNDLVEGEKAVYWRNSDPSIFYYEVQVSRDRDFGERGAKAAVYHNLIHGGVGDVLNRYVLPDTVQRDFDTPYYWRVRPRLQGDAAPVAWSNRVLKNGV